MRIDVFCVIASLLHNQKPIVYVTKKIWKFYINYLTDYKGEVISHIGVRFISD